MVKSLEGDHIWYDHKLYIPIKDTYDNYLICVSHSKSSNNDCYITVDRLNDNGDWYEFLIPTILNITSIEQLDQILKSNDIQQFKNNTYIQNPSLILQKIA